MLIRRKKIIQSRAPAGAQTWFVARVYSHCLECLVIALIFPSSSSIFMARRASEPEICAAAISTGEGIVSAAGIARALGTPHVPLVAARRPDGGRGRGRGGVPSACPRGWTA